MTSGGSLTQATDRLHASVAEGTALGPALAGIADALGADHVALWAREAGNGVSIHTARIDERDLWHLSAALAQYDLGALSPTRLPRGAPLTRSALMPDRDFIRTAYYNECIRPLNGFHAVFGKEWRGGQGFVIAVCRPRRKDDFTLAESARLRVLLPVLTTTLELQRRLWAMETRNAALAGVLDRLDAGVILTDVAGRPIFVNPRAEAMAADGDGFTVDDGGVYGATAAVTQAVKAAIAAAVSDGKGATRRVRLERPSSMPPLVATVVPVARLNLAVAGAADVHCAVFISATEALQAIDPRALCEFYRLTRRESEIAALLAAGNDVKRVAERLELGLTTVRSHLQRIFQKTDTHSQATLVARIRGIGSPFG